MGSRVDLSFFAGWMEGLIGLRVTFAVSTLFELTGIPLLFFLL